MYAGYRDPWWKISGDAYHTICGLPYHGTGRDTAKRPPRPPIDYAALDEMIHKRILTESAKQISKDCDCHYDTVARRAKKLGYVSPGRGGHDWHRVGEPPRNRRAKLDAAIHRLLSGASNTEAIQQETGYERTSITTRAHTLGYQYNQQAHRWESS